MSCVPYSKVWIGEKSNPKMGKVKRSKVVKMCSQRGAKETTVMVATCCCE
jgi:hypothetical protein